jgi:hypothetical protein
VRGVEGVRGGGVGGRPLFSFIGLLVKEAAMLQLRSFLVKGIPDFAEVHWPFSFGFFPLTSA